jgi:hypothetical protein
MSESFKGGCGCVWVVVKLTYRVSSKRPCSLVGYMLAELLRYVVDLSD